MRIALIRDGVVENVVEAEEEFAPPQGVLAVATQEAGPEWRYEAGIFLAPLEKAAVPGAITMFQAREQLRRIAAPEGGTLLDAVNALVEARRDEEPTLALAWEYATHVNRSSMFVGSLAARLSLSDETLDELFRQAATIIA